MLAPDAAQAALLPHSPGPATRRPGISRRHPLPVCMRARVCVHALAVGAIFPRGLAVPLRRARRPPCVPRCGRPRPAASARRLLGPAVSVSEGVLEGGACQLTDGDHACPRLWAGPGMVRGPLPTPVFKQRCLRVKWAGLEGLRRQVWLREAGAFSWGRAQGFGEQETRLGRSALGSWGSRPPRGSGDQLSQPRTPAPRRRAALQHLRLGRGCGRPEQAMPSASPPCISQGASESWAIPRAWGPAGPEQRLRRCAGAQSLHAGAQGTPLGDPAAFPCPAGQVLARRLAGSLGAGYF